jgi:hypothetical protein
MNSKEECAVDKLELESELERLTKSILRGNYFLLQETISM